MLTSLEIRTRITDLLSDSSSATQTLAGDLINDYLHMIYAMHDWSFDEDRTTATTTASTQFYQLPADVRKLRGDGVTITVGGVIYTPRQIFDEYSWNYLNSVSQTNDIPSYFFVRGPEYAQEVGFYPAPASSSNTITYRYKRRVVDLSFPANYTTGTITTLANAGTAVTGASTVWTAAMVGRLFRIDNGDTRWYRISARTSNTAITLQKGYLGTAIASGSEAYTIAEVAYLPEEYQLALVYGPLSDLYYRRNEEDRGAFYRQRFDDLIDRMKKSEGSKTMGVYIPHFRDLSMFDPNDPPTQALTAS